MEETNTNQFNQAQPEPIPSEPRRPLEPEPIHHTHPIKQRDMIEKYAKPLIAILLCISATMIYLNWSAGDSSYNLGYSKGANDTSFQAGYSRGVSDTANASFQKGFSTAIMETQNATLMAGYCAAEKDAVQNGVFYQNGTLLITPVSKLQSTCFR